jgi:GntR family transcriptional regulator, transcriptional repressor for pyruvate dehydrogenase complex
MTMTMTTAEPAEGRPSPMMTVGRSAMNGARVRKTAERVAEEIVREIVANCLRTGDRLPLEGEMVDHYRASRSSIREALRLLEVQGLIVLKPGPGGGPVVGQVDPANLARTASLYFHLGGATYESILRTQAMLEPLCAQLASRHLQRRVAMEPFVSPVRLRTPDEARRHGERLHAALHRLADNPIISMLTEAINRIVADHVLIDTSPTRLATLADERSAVARAVAAGRGEDASRAMYRMLRADHDWLREEAPAVLDMLIEWR